ncbi:MAG: alpha/beta hydrolase [Gemmatimonadetes bacterium]|nr:alpha/beta hydrolase [Gemmatimonadota bacterium]
MREVEILVLVVHDRADAEVPLSEGHACAAAFRNSQMMEVDAEGHRRMLKSPVVVAMVAAFFGSRAAREYGRTRIESDSLAASAKSTRDASSD